MQKTEVFQDVCFSFELVVNGMQLLLLYSNPSFSHYCDVFGAHCGQVTSPS